MQSYDVIPAVTGAAIGSVAAPVLAQVGALPGPQQEEWAGAIIGVVMLAIRELVWWLRNRKK